MTPEGPTEPKQPLPAEQPTAPLPVSKAQRGTSTWIAVGVSLVALLLSVISTGIALYAVSRSSGEKAAAASSAAPGGASPTAVGQQSPRPPESPAPSASAAPLDVLTATAELKPAYNTQELHPLANSNDYTYIDLDEPRVLQGNEKSDLYVRREYNTSAVPFFVFGRGTNVAVVASKDPNIQPADCANLIRTAPIQPDQRVPAQRETVICVATSLNDALEAGIKQKMVVLVVTSLSDDGRVSIRVSAWQIPT